MLATCLRILKAVWNFVLRLVLQLLPTTGTGDHPPERLQPYDSTGATGGGGGTTWYDLPSEGSFDEEAYEDEDECCSGESESGIDQVGAGESGGEEEEEEEALPAPDEGERWIPCRQTNGVAIYYHKPEGDKSGGEYMVSCVIRGRPSRVAAALMRLRGNTTILGPAAHVELLQPSGGAAGAGAATADTAATAGDVGRAGGTGAGDFLGGTGGGAAPVARSSVKGAGMGGGEETVTMRLVLTATGAAGWFCAPREMVVETLKKHEEDGVIVVLFKSVEPPPGPPGKGGGAGLLFGSGLFRRPVRGVVAGGYTIAGLRGEGASSSESLVTCIVKVDLGGCCGGGSWCRPLAAAAGWTDSFLERMLMSVHLLRDEVEQRRFQVQPFKLVASAKARFNARGRLVGGPLLPGARFTQQAAIIATPLFSRMASIRLLPPAVAAAAAAAATAAGGAGVGAGGVAIEGRAIPLPSRIAARRREFAATVTAGLAAAANGRRGTDGSAAGGPSTMTSVVAATAAAAAATGASAGGAGVSALAPPLTVVEAAAAAAMDQPYIQSLSLLPRRFWSEIHVPGADAPFRVRGSTYLKDKKKVPAGLPAFSLGSLEMIVLPPPGAPVAPGPRSSTAGEGGSGDGGGVGGAGGNLPGTQGVVEHVSRFLPAARLGGAPFSIIIHLVIPGTPLLGIVAVFCCDKHPNILGTPPARPMDEPHDWQPFDFVLHKFVYGSDETRNRMLKLIPHIASGSWMIKQSVGTTPVILGKALKTTYHCTPTYIEVDIDISANSVANYVTGMVRGATSSLDIDIGVVLEGTAPWELPECLLGCFRAHRLDTAGGASHLNWSRELPLRRGEGERSV